MRSSIITILALIGMFIATANISTAADGKNVSKPANTTNTVSRVLRSLGEMRQLGAAGRGGLR